MLPFLAMLAAPAPPALTRAWVHMVDNKIVIQGSTIEIHHFVDVSSASIIPGSGYRRIWEKDEWYPPKGKGLATTSFYVEMDRSGRRSRNIAYDEPSSGFLDTEKDAEWEPLRDGTLEWVLCSIPASDFVPKI